MMKRFFFTGLAAFSFSFSSMGSDVEIDACAGAGDKMLCVAKVFNRKLDLLTAAVQVVAITYYDGPNCTDPWGTGSIAIQSISNPGAVENICNGVAEQTKNVQSSNSTIESVLIGNGPCVPGLSISRIDTSAVSSDCVRRLRAL